MLYYAAINPNSLKLVIEAFPKKIESFLEEKDKLDITPVQHDFNQDVEPVTPFTEKFPDTILDQHNEESVNDFSTQISSNDTAESHFMLKFEVYCIWSLRHNFRGIGFILARKPLWCIGIQKKKWQKPYGFC